MAQTLRDKHDRSYTLNVNLGCARRIQEATALNLLADTVFTALSADDGKNAAAGGMAAALPRLEADPVLLAGVLWAAVEPEAETRKISREMFDDAWDGPTLKSAYRVLVEAITDFFPDRAEKIRRMADTLGEARVKETEAREAMVDAGRKLLEGIDVAAAVEQMLAQAEAKTPGKTSGGSAARSASPTPGASPSAS